MTLNKTLDYYLKLPYTIVLKPGQEEGDGWLAEIPELPGCFTAGDTKEEALHLLEEAKRLWLESSLAHGDPIPEPQIAL